MAGIWDFLDSLPKRSDVTPEELARRRQGYADLYQGGLLAGNRDQMPLSVQGAQATQDFLPVIGDALALGEAGEALSRGELAAAGLLGTAGIIGLVPGAGDALAKPVMAAGRRAADIARRIEVDPNALGSMGGNIRLRPENVTPAQEVAGLLSSGRADEVTDEMLAKFTPKDEMEIFDLYQRGATGVPMPMDEASRMARARDAGFDVNDEMYRGDAPRRSFETGRGQRDQIGVTMSTRPDVAASYIPPRGEGGIYPLFSRGENDATVYAGGQNWNVIDPDTQIAFQGGTSPLADYLPEDYFEPYDVMAGTAFADTNDLSRMFQGYGADRVRFNDLVDRGSSAKYYGPESSMPSDVVMVSDPSNVRSRFARFDPRLAHLRNLSAGVGGLGLLSSMMPPEEQY